MIARVEDYIVTATSSKISWACNLLSGDELCVSEIEN